MFVFLVSVLTYSWRKKPSVFTLMNVTIWECQWSFWNWIFQPRRGKNRGGKWKTGKAMMHTFLKSDIESPCPIHYRGMKFKVRNLAWWEINQLHHMLCVDTMCLSSRQLVYISPDHGYNNSYNDREANKILLC